MINIKQTNLNAIAGSSRQEDIVEVRWNTAVTLRDVLGNVLPCHFNTKTVAV